LHLDEAEIGRKVVYIPKHGKREDGVITSKNHKFIFVRYGNNVTSIATNPKDLFYLKKKKCLINFY
jgi:hypothetical protein